MADSNTEFTTIIGSDALFKGELSFDSSAKVLGRIEGSISSKGKVLVADGSKCVATVHAKDISVEGLVEGNVEATERLELKPKGTIVGDVTAARMIMADGASIDGHCRIGVNGHVKGSAAPTTTELKPAVQPQPAMAAKK